jgi:hypothetical protein
MATLTTILAVWGAIVSTSVALWNIRRDLLDRGRLHILCYIGVTRGLSPDEDAGRRLVYHVTNTGRRPIVVTHLGGAFTKGEHFMVPTAVPLPRMLQPGEYLVEYTQDLSMLERSPQALWAIDSLQRYWKIPRRHLWQLVRDATQPQREEA